MPRVPNADESRNILEHHVIGNKADAIATAVNSTNSLVAYAKAAFASIFGTAGIASFPAAAAPANNVSLAEVLREIYELGERVISKTAVALDGGDVDDMFTIAGGPIEIINIWVDVTEAVSAHAALLHFESNPTIGASSTQIAEGTAGPDVQSAALGDVFHLNGDSQDVMKKAAVGTDLAMKENQNGGIFCPVGKIDMKLSTSNPTSGIATVWMRYKPLARGVTVT